MNLKDKVTSALKVGAVSLVGILPILSTGCTYYSKEGSFRGYRVNTSIDGSQRRILIQDPKPENPIFYIGISATDEDVDGRFDRIYLNIPKGHPLEKYASLDSLEAAYQSVTNQDK